MNLKYWWLLCYWKFIPLCRNIFCYITICQIQLCLWRPHDKYDTGKLLMHLETLRIGVGCGIDTSIVKKTPRICFCFFFFFFFALWNREFMYWSPLWIIIIYRQLVIMAIIDRYRYMYTVTFCYTLTWTDI